MKRFLAGMFTIFLWLGIVSFVLDNVDMLTEQSKVPTIKSLLETALEPVGSTMYIWGGGWNESDTATGPDGMKIGVSPQWKIFADRQTATYDYRNYRYKLGYGLDCSGYVGWTIYNTVEKPAPEGYVMNASEQASYLAQQGFGTYENRYNINDYRAGDIMSSECSCCGHVWIVIGECEDGSVVLVHSSPPGVRICGTVTPEGDINSEAVTLAEKYMKCYYKHWYKRYPSCVVDSKYLTHYGQMRWELDQSVMTDPDGFRHMKAEEILKELYG